MREDKLQLLDVLDAAGARARSRAVSAAWVAVAAAGLVLAAIVFVGSREIARQRTDLAGVTTERNNKRLEVTTLENQRKGLQAEINELRRIRENYAASAAAQSVAAVEQATPVPPQSEGAQPRAYLQVVDASDRAYAAAIGRQLGKAGFLVLGVEFVRNAPRLKNTEVRYYKKADEAGARRLLSALESAGVRSPVLLYLNLEQNTRVRANQYEVWFAYGVGSAPSG